MDCFTVAARRVGRIVVVEVDPEGGEIALVAGLDQYPADFVVAGVTHGVIPEKGTAQRLLAHTPTFDVARGLLRRLARDDLGASNG